MVRRKERSRGIQERCLFSAADGAEHSRQDLDRRKTHGRFLKQALSLPQRFWVTLESSLPAESCQ